MYYTTFTTIFRVKKCYFTMILRVKNCHFHYDMQKIVYYVMRSKNEVLCAAAGRLAAECSEADKPAKAHKIIFAPNNIYTIFSSNLRNKLFKTC
jgi:hypothetical protein